MKFKHLLLIFCTVACIQVSGQDFHHSYFQFAPLNVNPALTGAFYGNLRASVIGRDQGRATAGSGNEFRDLSLALDGSIDFGLTEGDWVSAGMTLAKSGRAGEIGFARDFSGLAVAYHLAYGRKKDKVFSLGVKYGSYTVGRYSENADYRTLNMLINNVLSDQDTESVGQNGLQTKGGDFALGLMLTTPMGRSSDLRLGVSVDNLTKPEFMLDGDSIDPSPPSPNPNPTPVTIQSNMLDRRFSAFISYYTPISKKLTFNPNLLVQRMSGTNNILLQGLFNYTMDPIKNISLNFGIGIRPSDALDIPIFVGIDIEDLRVGLSYDTSVTGLQNDTFGALELGISKIFSWEKKVVIKPVLVCPRL